MIDAIKAASPDVVAASLGIPINGASLLACPACGAEQRSRTDRRAPVSMRTTAGAVRWRCWACNARGSLLDVAAFALCGGEYDHGKHADTVRAWATRAGIIDGTTDTPAARPFRRKTPPLPPPPPRPDRREIVRLWRSSAPFGKPTPWVRKHRADAVALDWLKARNTSERDQRRRFWPVDDLGAIDVVRLLPPAREYDWPDFWPFNRKTPDCYRLACLAFESNGAIGSIHARSVRDDKTGRSKTRWPASGPGSAGGLILAGPRGVRLLRGDTAPIDGVVIVEGITDLVAAALVFYRTGRNLIALGGVAGSLQAFSSVDWPRTVRDGAPVYIAVDDDDAGNGYAAELSRALYRHKKLNLIRRPWEHK